MYFLHNPTKQKALRESKTLPREHLIGCQGVKMFLLDDPFKLFHQLGPTGPSWSRSRHVRGSVCVSVCAIAKHPLPEVV